MINNNNETLGLELAENLVAISKLIEEIDADALDPKVQSLITRLMVYHRQYHSVIAVQQLNRGTKINDEVLSLFAEQSWISQGFESTPNRELTDVEAKSVIAYKAVEAIIPKESQSILFALNEVTGDQLYITGKQGYISGFENALKAIGTSDEGNVN